MVTFSRDRINKWKFDINTKVAIPTLVIASHSRFHFGHIYVPFSLDTNRHGVIILTHIYCRSN